MEGLRSTFLPWRASVVAGGVLVAALASCDLIVGLEEGTPRPGGPGPGSGSGGGGGAGACDASACPGADEDCRARTCSATAGCGFANDPAHKPCAGGAKVCDGDGSCVGCVDATDCKDATTPDCVANVCVPAHCSNGEKDAAETDVDCGADCAPCADGKACNGAADCSSGLCVNNTCTPCGSESGCQGGKYCDAGVCKPLKKIGDGCAGAVECESGACASGVCCSAPSCPSCQACNVAGSVGSCAPIADGSGCDDGVFCNGSDQCQAGACSEHAGNPCPGPDGDGNCSESCNEDADDCTAADPSGAACNDGLYCTGADSCHLGQCSQHTGDPCPGPNGDGNCSESCNEDADNCTLADPNYTSCQAGGCNDYCIGGACQYQGCGSNF